MAYRWKAGAMTSHKMNTTDSLLIVGVFLFVFCVVPSVLHRKNHVFYLPEVIIVCLVVGGMVYTWPKNGDPIMLYLSSEYTQGDIRTHEIADGFCYAINCRHSAAVLLFDGEKLSDLPHRLNLPSYSSVWFNDELIAYSWEDFIHTSNLPSKEPFWTGAGDGWSQHNCKNWSGSGSGSGVGVLGQHSLDQATATCAESYRLLCLCV